MQRLRLRRLHVEPAAFDWLRGSSVYRWAVLATLLSCLLFSSSSTAQRSGNFATSESSWEGYSEFLRLAQRRVGTSRIRPVARLNYDMLKPGDSLIIVSPQTPLDSASLNAFLADGGRVALLDDYGTGDKLLQSFGIKRKAPPADPERRLRGNPDLAIAVPSEHHKDGTSGTLHPITAKVEAVVTNHPVALHHPHLTSVLEIRDSRGSSSALAITGVIAKRGRLFVMGDPSVFINLMLRYPGNRHLAVGLIDYLSSRNEGEINTKLTKETKAEMARIWLVTNHFEQIGRYGDSSGFYDALMDKFEDLKSAVEHIDDDGLPSKVATGLSALLALWALSTMISRNLQGGDLHFPSFARAPILAAQLGVGARASVLASPQSNPILALMELDAALRETIARRLSFSAALPPLQLSEALQNHGVSKQSAAEICALLSELRRQAERLKRRWSRRPTRALMKRVHEESMRLLKEIEAAGSKR